MPRIFAIATLSATSLMLTGCSVFYPNWGATTFPEPTQTTSETASAEPSATAEPTPSETPTETASAEPTATETAAVKRKSVDVEIIMAIPDTGAGVLTVVAQVPTLSEAGGKCTMKFISGDTEKTLEVKAEPSSDYTQCFPIEYPLADLPNGNGVVTVTYESEGHVGTSAPVSPRWVAKVVDFCNGFLSSITTF